MATPEHLDKIKADIAAKILGGEKRHFLDFHFINNTQFAQDFIDFTCRLEQLSPGAGYEITKRLGGLQGQERSTYDQIVQTLCELVIAKKFIDSYPPEQGYIFKWEPTDKAKTNPEFMIIGKEWRLLVEVKAPSLIDYDTKNRAAAMQLPSRLPGMKEWMTSMTGEEPALPLDNKVKDYLVSAEKKFSSFDEIEIPTYGLLFICWGERMFEGVGPLSNEGCGLLKDRSFYEVCGEKVRFPHVSGVIVTQHQFFIQQVLAERLPFPRLSSLDYGEYWTYNSPTNPAFCENIYARLQLPQEFNKVLQTVPAGESLDPMGNIIDTVFWLHRTDSVTERTRQDKVGRNDPCPCGSGGKYKKCCGQPR